MFFVSCVVQPFWLEFYCVGRFNFVNPRWFQGHMRQSNMYLPLKHCTSQRLGGGWFQALITCYLFRVPGTVLARIYFVGRLNSVSPKIFSAT